MPIHSACLAHGIGRRLQALSEPPIAVIRRLLDCAVHAKFPAVIEAPYAVFFDSAECQRCPPVHAKLIEEADPAARITKGNELLAEESNTKWLAVRCGQLRRCADWMPIATHRAPHGHVRPDTRKDLVVLRAQHGAGPPFRLRPPILGASTRDRS